MDTKKKDNELLYADLTYKIIGALFAAANNVGSGHKEKFYQKAVAKELKDAGLGFVEQLQAKIDYKGELLGTYYFDFLIENKVVLEIKVRNYFSRQDIEQLLRYLKAKDLKLGIIAHFTKGGVKFKRVVNLR